MNRINMVKLHKKFAILLRNGYRYGRNNTEQRQDTYKLRRVVSAISNVQILLSDVKGRQVLDYSLNCIL